MLFVTGIILIVVIFILIKVSTNNALLRKQLKQKVEKDKETEKCNEALRKQKAELEENVKTINDVINTKDSELQLKTNNINSLNQRIEDKQKQVDQLSNTIQEHQQISEDAFTQYFKILNQRYEEVEEEFDNNVAKLREQQAQIVKELDKMCQTRAAAHEALLKEIEVKENKDNYRLKPSDSDLSDARRLEIVKRELNKPRILAMLIWQTYYQPLAKKLFPLILKDKTKCGIYKITNLITDECYIGQSVDIYKRWNDHCKCGLGIDTPPGNKLYKAMQEYGLENFTFELLEECSNSELDEKEAYFIKFYQADTYGYNGTKGNK